MKKFLSLPLCMRSCTRCFCAHPLSFNTVSIPDKPEAELKGTERNCVAKPSSFREQAGGADGMRRIRSVGHGLGLLPLFPVPPKRERAGIAADPFGKEEENEKVSVAASLHAVLRPLLLCSPAFFQHRQYTR